MDIRINSFNKNVFLWYLLYYCCILISKHVERAANLFVEYFCFLSKFSTEFNANNCKIVENDEISN